MNYRDFLHHQLQQYILMPPAEKIPKTDQAGRHIAGKYKYARYRQDGNWAEIFLNVSYGRKISGHHAEIQFILDHFGNKHDCTRARKQAVKYKP